MSDYEEYLDKRAVLTVDVSAFRHEGEWFVDGAPDAYINESVTPGDHSAYFTSVGVFFEEMGMCVYGLLKEADERYSESRGSS
jgi:hypothetical protein